MRSNKVNKINKINKIKKAAGREEMAY